MSMVTGFPLDVEIVAGQLSVRIYSHSIRPSDERFWTFVSRGLRSVGQRELVITLRRRTDEEETAFPPWVFGTLRDVQRKARAGELVRPGGHSEVHFRDPESIQGLLYVPAQPLPGVEVPADAVAAIPVGPDDLAVAQRVGTYRVLIRLGRRERYFPFPPWGARDGPPGAPPGADAGSMLSRLTQLRLPSITFLVRTHTHTVEMSLPRGDAGGLPRLLAEIPPDTAFAILGSPAPQANALLVWFPGQREREAISAPGSDGSRLGGLHLIVAVAAGEGRLTIIEDGFGAVFTPSSWQSFTSALSRRGPFKIPPNDQGPGFEVVWM